MKKAPYVKGRKYDEMLEVILKTIKYAQDEQNDDFLLLCCGETNTGKSSLMLHSLEYLKGNNPNNINFIGLDKKGFANALYESSEGEFPRMCCNDEANISSRDSLSKYNKELIDLYFSIRGLRIFHWWNNPSLDVIDKRFITEVIKGVILITTKDNDRPRLYYYFTKQDLLKIWEKYSNLKLNLLKRIKKEYAFYRGWFRKYDGELWIPYDKKKKSRMKNKVSNFRDTWGGSDEEISRGDMAKNVGLTPRTLAKYEKDLDDKLIIRKTNGNVYYKPEAEKVILQMAEERKKKLFSNLNVKNE